MTSSHFSYSRAALPAILLAGAGIALAAMAAAQVKGSPWGFAGDTAPSQRQVIFDGGGRLTGFGGCNRFSGAFELSEGQLKVGPIVATRRACPEDVMKREDEFFQILQSARTAKASKDELVLKAEDGTVLATLVRVPKE